MFFGILASLLPVNDIFTDSLYSCPQKCKPEGNSLILNRMTACGNHVMIKCLSEAYP